jgi:phosphatidylethanolamine/phosphatidyl-N-methylethanolamine N-methyltransferase
MPLAERLDFLCQWLSNPLQVGAVTPSGKALSDLITRHIDASTAPVIELGPGTGVFTRALLDRGIREESLVLIEYSSEFTATLRRRFPRAQILQLDAATLASVDLLGGEKAGAVVSGLPMLSMRPKKAMMILKGAFGHLRRRGAFYQFTYTHQCPVPRAITERLASRQSVSVGHWRTSRPRRSIGFRAAAPCIPRYKTAIRYPPPRISEHSAHTVNAPSL